LLVVSVSIDLRRTDRPVLAVVEDVELGRGDDVRPDGHLLANRKWVARRQQRGVFGI
jgi:hypothetical protein